MESKPCVIGITGGFGSGKSTAADFLKPLGFARISLVQFLEEELKKKGRKNITRGMLQDLGNKWREKFGRGVLAKKALNFIKKEKIKKAVVDGFRNVGEIEEFRKRSNFLLLGIVANRSIRFKRLKNLKRREHLTWKIFNKLDNRDLGVNEKDTGLQVAICLALSDVFVENNGSLDMLKNKMEDIVNKIEKEDE